MNDLTIPLIILCCPSALALVIIAARLTLDTWTGGRNWK